MESRPRKSYDIGDDKTDAMLQQMYTADDEKTKRRSSIQALATSARNGLLKSSRNTRIAVVLIAIIGVFVGISSISSTSKRRYSATGTIIQSSSTSSKESSGGNNLRGSDGEKKKKKNDDDKEDQFRYVVIIDAGSSGSRAHVFRYTTADHVVSPEHESLKVKPGLSSFAENPEAAGESLREAIDFAKEHVPESMRQSTPILLKATAGMRLLPDDQKTAVMENVREYLSSKSGFKLREAHVIDGEEEGLLGWLSVNYLNQSPGNWGVMELGGASIQVTMKIDDGDGVPEQHVRSYQLPNDANPGNVYTHSFLGLGMESARRAVTKLLESTGASEDPCLQKGYVKPDGSDSDLFAGSKTGLTPSGSYDECAALIKKALFKDQHNSDNAEDCPYKHKPNGCLFNGLYAPDLTKNKHQKFWAFENFYYTPSALGVNGVPGETTIRLLEESAKTNCGMDWSTMDSTHPKDWQPKEINNKWCFGSTYIYTLLTTGLQFDPDARVTVSNNVDKNGIDWALGAALQAISS